MLPGAYSSARLERFPDKEEVDGSSPSRPTEGGIDVKKILTMALAVAGAVWFSNRRKSAAQPDAWAQHSDPV